VRKRRIPTGLGLLLLIVLEVFGIALLFISSSSSNIIRGVAAQAILFVVSMIIIWYAAHPLSHYLAARISRVRTLFFFIGPSDMGKSGESPSILRKISPFLITVGTKLDRARLAALSKMRRGWILGIGAIAGLIILALIELFAIFASKLSLASLVLGGLFFLLTLGTEIVLSTKSGDISKMRKEQQSSS
jgi:hypothetical protein